MGTDRVFVFGSNLAGRHGKGAALHARQHHGAIYGVGEGRQGNSYAIPTKGRRLEVLPLEEIERHVSRFIFHAMCKGADTFQLTPIGCGLAGYKPEQIAPMFRDAPPNVILPDEFKAALGSADDPAPAALDPLQPSLTSECQREPEATSLNQQNSGSEERWR